MKVNTTILVLAALAAASALGGCGKQGLLERPAPMFGRSPTEPGAFATARGDAAARAKADGALTAGPVAPQSVDEVRNAGPLPLGPGPSETNSPNPETPLPPPPSQQVQTSQ